MTLLFSPYSRGLLLAFGLYATALLSAALAQEALRAPLSIVPPPMQAVLGTAPSSDDATGKLAPKVAARQMKRAVRAVAATPGRDGDIVQIGQLGALEDAPIGLEPGLGKNLWTGARLAFVTAQMARLPNQIAMPSLYNLERRLHRGTTAAPIGSADDTSWFAARMMRLLALGDTASAIALEAETGAAKGDGYAARALALAHLGRGQKAAACAVPRPKRGTMGRRNTIEFFMQMLVYCQLLNGEFEKASLTLELNEKTLGKDKLFRDIAYLMSAQAPLIFTTQKENPAEGAKTADETDDASIIQLPDELTPMQIALLQLAGQALPAGLRNLPNYFMGAIAVDFAQNPVVQLRAAHLAVRYGASPELFAQTAQLSDLAALAGKLPPREKLSASVFLAQALQVIDATPIDAQARLIAHYLRQAAVRDLWHDMVRILDDRLADLSVPQAASAAEGDTGINDQAGFSVDAGGVFDNQDADRLQPLAGIDGETEILDAHDRLIILLAQWQAGNRAEAENLMRLAPLSETVELLARWQGFNLDAPLQAENDAAIAISQNVTDNAQSVTLANADLPALGVDELDVIATGDIAEALSAEMDEPQQPIFVLADILQPDWTRFEARLSSAAPFEALHMRRQLAIYHALGVTLPDTLLVDLVLVEQDPIFLRLARLADNRWIGDLILAQVAHLANKPASSYDATDARLLIGSLVRAGLGETAQQLAGDILTGYMAMAAARAPDILQTQSNETALRDRPMPFRALPFNAGENGR